MHTHACTLTPLHPPTYTHGHSCTDRFSSFDSWYLLRRAQTFDCHLCIASCIVYYFFCRDNVRLFVDGKLSGSTRVNGLANGDEKFSIPIVATNPLPLLVGGSSSSHGNFTGCLKNLAYNYESVMYMFIGDVKLHLCLLFLYSAIAFLNEAVTPPNAISAPGVSFNRCPFLPERGTALIPLSPPTPVDRTCFSNPPHRLDGTHGGFHSNTRLTSGNIIGLDTQLVQCSTCELHVLCLSLCMF